jgi:hypothetical protein
VECTTLWAILPDILHLKSPFYKGSASRAPTMLRCMSQEVAHSRYDARSPGHDSYGGYCGPMWGFRRQLIAGRSRAGNAMAGGSQHHERNQRPNRLLRIRVHTQKVGAVADRRRFGLDLPSGLEPHDRITRQPAHGLARMPPADQRTQCPSHPSPTAISLA